MHSKNIQIFLIQYYFIWCSYAIVFSPSHSGLIIAKFSQLFSFIRKTMVIRTDNEKELLKAYLTLWWCENLCITSLNLKTEEMLEPITPEYLLAYHWGIVCPENTNPLSVFISEKMIAFVYQENLTDFKWEICFFP